MSDQGTILPNNQYVLNDLFFRDILIVLAYDDNGVLIYDPIYYEVVDIFLGVCNIIFNRVAYIHQHNIDSFFNSIDNIAIYHSLGNILSLNAYPSKYIELKTENNTNSLYYKFFEELKPKDLIELRYDQNNIYIDIFQIIKNICDS
jgi:hypothetical protein